MNLLRTLARQARSLVDLRFMRCETCANFQPRVSLPHEDKAPELVLVTCQLPGEPEPQLRLMPPRSAELVEGATVHGRLSDTGLCQKDELGHLPTDRCPSWR